jgi:hypothetical protein
MKLRAQVGVYLTNGVADAVADARIGDAGDEIEVDGIAPGQGGPAAVPDFLDVDALIRGGGKSVVNP